MRHYKFSSVAVLVAIIAVSGCGQKEQPAASAEKSGARAVEPAAAQSSAGLPESCVGLGCDGEVSVGLQEECVGMGCPSDAN